MAKKTVTIEILRQTFISGELAEVGDVFVVPETDGHYLINSKKAKACSPAVAKAASKKKATTKGKGKPAQE